MRCRTLNIRTDGVGAKRRLCTPQTKPTVSMAKIKKIRTISQSFFITGSILSTPDGKAATYHQNCAYLGPYPVS